MAHKTEQPKVENPPIAKITVDPKVRGGVPCVGSGRWPITHLLEKLATGMNNQQLLQVFPGLTLADLQMALSAAAWVMRDPMIDWSEMSLQDMVDFQDELRQWQSLSHDALSQLDDSMGD